ncbi:alcohol dehydrogenase GroES-like domain-containing protein [Poronia punctata]|nr:alcohol dehydrogenase GroES-like domain-containing protein [Poronia punctata]
MSNSTTVQASVLYGAKDLRVEQRDLPAPSPTEVQIAVSATGLCGSDLHYYNHFRNGNIQVVEPLTLGHESAGVVTAVGSAVTDLAPGDRIALEVGQPCETETCEFCKSGRYNICKGMRFRSSAKSVPHAQGTLQTRINHPARWCHKLPEGMSLELGALAEPLSVALHAHQRSGVQNVDGASVLVLGAGAVGLLCAAAAKVHGAKTVLIADILPERVQFAVENGFADAAFTVPLARPVTVEDKLAYAQEVTEKMKNVAVAEGTVGEVDVTFECTGVESCMHMAIYCTKPGGKVMIIGMGTPIQTLPISTASLKEVDLLGVFRYANSYPRAIDLLSGELQNMPDLSKLVTQRFRGLESIPVAFDMAGKVKDQEGNLVIKVMIDTSEEAAS